MQQIILYGIAGADSQYRVVRYYVIDAELVSISRIIFHANLIRIKYPNIEHVYAVDNRRGLRREYMESIKKELDRELCYLQRYSRERRFEDYLTNLKKGRAPETWRLLFLIYMQFNERRKILRSFKIFRVTNILFNGELTLIRKEIVMFIRESIYKVLGFEASENSKKVIPLNTDASGTIGIRLEQDERVCEVEVQEEYDDLNWTPIVDSIGINI